MLTLRLLVYPGRVYFVSRGQIEESSVWEYSWVL